MFMEKLKYVEKTQNSEFLAINLKSILNNIV